MRRNDEHHPDLNFVRIGQFVTVGVEDLHVFVRITVELAADLGECIARLDGVSLARTCRRGSSGRFGHRNIRDQITMLRIHQLNLIPNTILGIGGWSSPADYQFAVLDVQVGQSYQLLLDRPQHALILLLESVEYFFVGGRGRRAAAEHLVKESHGDGRSTFSAGCGVQ